MKNVTFNAIVQEDREELFQLMIEPSRQFVGDSAEYKVNLDADAIDTKNLLVRIDKWMDTMLDFDEFSTWINRILYLQEKESEDERLWDYNVPEYLSDLGIEVDNIQSGYTYNDGGDYSRLDRDIHFTTFEYESEYYVVFSVHYGADARAGFGDFVCFKINDYAYFGTGMEIEAYIDDNANEEISCNEIEDIATYNEDRDSWVHNETGKELTLYSSSNGF